MGTISVSVSDSVESTRIDFRTKTHIKRTIEKAALLSGQTVSDFANSHLYQIAQQIVEDHETITLSEADARRFLQALDSADGPSVTLRRAAEKFKGWEEGTSAAAAGKEE